MAVWHSRSSRATESAEAPDPARRDDEEWHRYFEEEQRRGAGCIGARMVETLLEHHTTRFMQESPAYPAGLSHYS